MGDLVRGAWRAEGDFPHDRTGQFVRPDAPFRNWVTPDGATGTERAGRLQGRARPLPSLRGAFLPLGAPNAHLPRAQRSAIHDQRLDRPLADARKRHHFFAR